MLRVVSKKLLDIVSNNKRGGVIINAHTLSRAETRRFVNVLDSTFDFIHHDELLERIENPPKKPFCLLTFDDGKLSNFTETAPELEQLGVPAVFYVVTASLTENIPLWFDRYGSLVQSLGYVPPGFEMQKLKGLTLDSVNEKIESEIAKHNLKLNMNSYDMQLMSWDDVRDLSQRGFTIGAHSANHAILTNEKEVKALLSIEHSISEVAKQVGIPCLSFAFPNGNYTSQLAKYAIKCGVQTVMTTDPVWVDSRFPRWKLPRVQLSGNHSDSIIRLKLAVAATGKILLNPNGEGRQYKKKIWM